MIPLRVRTEYSFGVAFGQTRKVIEALASFPAAAICDNGAWGHVEFFGDMKSAKKKPLLGIELAVVPQLAEEQRADRFAMIARTDAGLREIYALLSEATQTSKNEDDPASGNFYYIPRITWKRLAAVGSDVLLLSDPNPNWTELAKVKKMKNLFAFAAPTSQLNIADNAKALGLRVVAGFDNLFPRPEHRAAYEIVASRPDSSAAPRYIMTEDELRAEMPHLADEAFSLSDKLAGECAASLPKAENVKFKSAKTLRQLCVEAAPRRKINLKDPVYAARLERELKLIAEKDFADYFFVIWDLIKFAKSRMLVGPARGSSCGSLVCYLLGITEVDPIPFGLLFERFIDVTRTDLPDIDIDFADDRRDLVFEYLINKYGAECVTRLGTVNRFKAKSALDLVAKKLEIPAWEIKDLKNSIIVRSSGDSRAAFCIADTLEYLEIGRQVVGKYPGLVASADIEDHANHTGQHAAGIVVTAKPTREYCAIDQRKGVAQVDKYDAEKLNLLKIDALGLRTLSVIQDCLDQIGKDRDWLLSYPKDDKAALDIIRKHKFGGIFQFEGLALQNLIRRYDIDINFNDVVAFTALARPGPLNSGGATDYLNRRIGAVPIEYLHETVRPMTEVTYGVVVYQEQVMQIVREVGGLSWEDTSTLRKAMSKSFGEEYFNQFWDRFKVGAAKRGLSEKEARHVWDHVNTMGSWSFNQSHAVAYGLVSYWCMVLKSKHPVEWAAACLRNAKDEEQEITLLRELVNEGYTYIPFDRERSEVAWSVKDGVLIGGFLGIKGVGKKKAVKLFEKVRGGKKLTEAERKLVEEPQLSYADVFETDTLWGHLKKDPAAYKIYTPLRDIGTLTGDDGGNWCVIGKMVVKNLRDLNEPAYVVKRGGKRETHHETYLNLVLEDDTGNIVCTIGRYEYEKLGKPIVESGVIGDWFLARGFLRSPYRKLYLDRIVKLEPGGRYSRKTGEIDKPPVSGEEEDGDR